MLLDIQKDPLVAEVLKAKKRHVDGADFEDISLHVEQEDNDEVYVSAIAQLDKVFTLSERAGINQLQRFKELVTPVSVY